MQKLVALGKKLHPDLTITDIKMPEMDGIDASVALYRHCPVPVILVSAHYDAELIKRAESDHVMGYLVKPIKQSDLEPVIALAIRRFEQFQALRLEAADLRQALEDRKVIERAKGLLMKKAGLDEQARFSAGCRKLASDKNLRIGGDCQDHHDRRRGVSLLIILISILLHSTSQRGMVFNMLDRGRRNADSLQHRTRWRGSAASTSLLTGIRCRQVSDLKPREYSCFPPGGAISPNGHRPSVIKNDRTAAGV